MIIDTQWLHLLHAFHGWGYGNWCKNYVIFSMMMKLPKIVSPLTHWFEKGVILTKWRQLVLSTYEIPGKKKRVNFKFTKKSLTRNQCAEGEMWFSGAFKRNLSSHKSSSSGINWKSPIMNIVIWCKVESKYAAETSPGILGLRSGKVIFLHFFGYISFFWLFSRFFLRKGL